MLQGVEEFRNKLIKEFGAVFEVVHQKGARLIFSTRMEDSIETLAKLVAICTNTNAFGLPSYVADKEAAEFVGVVLVDPAVEECVEVWLHFLIVIETGCGDFYGAVKVKGLIHAKFLLFVDFATKNSGYGHSMQ